MKTPGISMDELTAMQKKQTNGNRFTAEDERKVALSILGRAELTELSQKERKRVLIRATKINEV